MKIGRGVYLSDRATQTAYLRFPVVEVRALVFL